MHVVQGLGAQLVIAPTVEHIDPRMKLNYIRNVFDFFSVIQNRTKLIWIENMIMVLTLDKCRQQKYLVDFL